MARPKNARDPIIERVLEASSNATVLAGRLGIRPSAVSQWKVIPLKRVPEVARITGIPEHELRPDVAELFARGSAPDAAA